MKKTIAVISVILYTIAGYLAGFFYLHFSFWKGSITFPAAVAIVASTSLMLISYIGTCFAVTRRVCRILYLISASFLCFMIGSAALCWSLYLGYTYHFFTATDSFPGTINYPGVLIQTAVLLLGIFSVKANNALFSKNSAWELVQRCAKDGE